MNDLIKNIKIMIFGSGVSKLIGIAIIPLLSRLYTPEEFGVQSLFNSLTLLLVPMMTFRYVIAINLPRCERIAINVIFLCLFFIVVNFVFYFFIVAIIDFYDFNYFSSLGLYIYFIPIAASLIAIFEVTSYWLSRRKLFNVLATCNIIQGASGAISKLLLSLVNISSFGLIIGQIMQQSNGLFYAVKKSGPYNLKGIIKKRYLKLLAFYYSSFPKYRLLSQMLLVFSLQMPVFYFSKMYDVATVGQLSLAMMMLTLPVTLFGNSAGKVYYSKISELGRYKARDIYVLTFSLTKKLFALSLPIALVIFIVSPLVFEFFFGEKWRLSGEIASLMSIMIVPQFLSSPIINVFNVFNKQRISLTLNVFRVAMLFVIFYISDSFGFPVLKTVLIYSFFSLGYYFFVVLIIFKVIKNEIID